MRQDQVDALRIGGIEPNRLCNRLMQEHGLSTDPPAQIRDLV
jgi:hypothetical protein